MRRLLFFVIVLFLSVVRVSADPVETPDAIYGHAMHGLVIGHDYERDIQQLNYLIAHDPGNRKYHLALGCADADRAASLGYAAIWTKTLADAHATYPQDVKDWQAAQRDPKSDNFGDPAPALPPDITFPTKDDDYPFVMPLPKAEARVKTLVISAQDEWKRALSLSQTPAERAEVEWTQGTGMNLLRLLITDNLTGYTTGVGPIMKDAKPLPTEAMSIAILTSATKEAPDNAVYWQALGDALFKQSNSADAPDYGKTLAAYNKSLALQPVNAPLWFRLYIIYSDHNNSQLIPAKAALQHVIDSDPNNAYPYYLMAAIEMHAAHYNNVHDGTESADRDKALRASYDIFQKTAADTALSLIEQGSAAFHYFAISYSPARPAALSGFAIWRSLINDTEWVGYSTIRELARAGGGYARVAALQGDRSEAERAARDVIGMGLKMCGDWPLQEHRDAGISFMDSLTGGAVSSIGYNDLVKGETDMGNTMAIGQAQAEYDTYKAHQAVYRQALNAVLSAPSFLYSDY